MTVQRWGERELVSRPISQQCGRCKFEQIRRETKERQRQSKAVAESKEKAHADRIIKFQKIASLPDRNEALVLMAWEVQLVSGRLGIPQNELDGWERLQASSGYRQYAEFEGFCAEVITQPYKGPAFGVFAEGRQSPWNSRRISDWFMRRASDRGVLPETSFVHSRRGRKAGKVVSNSPIPAWHLGTRIVARNSEKLESYFLNDGRIVEREEERWLSEPRGLVNPSPQWQKEPLEVEMTAGHLVRLVELLRLNDEYDVGQNGSVSTK